MLVKVRFGNFRGNFKRKAHKESVEQQTLKYLQHHFGQRLPPLRFAMTVQLKALEVIAVDSVLAQSTCEGLSEQLCSAIWSNNMQANLEALQEKLHTSSFEQDNQMLREAGITSWRAKYWIIKTGRDVKHPWSVEDCRDRFLAEMKSLEELKRAANEQREDYLQAIAFCILVLQRLRFGEVKTTVELTRCAKNEDANNFILALFTNRYQCSSLTQYLLAAADYYGYGPWLATCFDPKYQPREEPEIVAPHHKRGFFSVGKDLRAFLYDSALPIVAFKTTIKDSISIGEQYLLDELKMPEAVKLRMSVVEEYVHGHISKDWGSFNELIRSILRSRRPNLQLSLLATILNQRSICLLKDIKALSGKIAQSQASLPTQVLVILKSALMILLKLILRNIESWFPELDMFTHNEYGLFGILGLNDSRLRISSE